METEYFYIMTVSPVWKGGRREPITWHGKTTASGVPDVYYHAFEKAKLAWDARHLPDVARCYFVVDFFFVEEVKSA